MRLKPPKAPLDAEESPFAESLCPLQPIAITIEIHINPLNGEEYQVERSFLVYL
jgi:hypothetical protein